MNTLRWRDPLIALTLGLVFVASPAPVAAQDEVNSERRFYTQLAEKIEPGRTGSLERLPVYLQFFRREMINDARLFAFEVRSRGRVDGTIELTGFVEFEESRHALVRFLQQLGFENVEDRIELVPNASLGRRRFGFVRVPHSLSYDRPSHDGEVVTDCLLGEPLFLLAKTDERYYLCHSAEGYVGYVRCNDVYHVTGEEFARCLEGRYATAKCDVQSATSEHIPMGARLPSLRTVDEDVVVQLPWGGESTIPASSCRIVGDEPNSRLQRVVDNAMRLVGTPYLWGGKTASGIDCSGLIQVAFAAEGLNLPRDSNQQVYLGRLTGTRWHRRSMRRGDTLYFLGPRGKIRHTAVYLGQDQYLEAVRPTVRVTSFNPEHANYHASRAASFAFAKRLLD